MRRRGSVRPSADDSSAGVWNRDDMHALQRSIDPLQRKLKLRPVMGWLRSPEISSMLCGPPDTIFQRLEGFLSVINIMSGLLLSAIGGSALKAGWLNSRLPGSFRLNQRLGLVGGLLDRADMEPFFAHMKRVHGKTWAHMGIAAQEHSAGDLLPEIGVPTLVEVRAYEMVQFSPEGVEIPTEEIEAIRDEIPVDERKEDNPAEWTFGLGTFLARVRDLSAEGCGVETAEPMMVGMRVSVDLIVEGRMLSLHGRVVWVSKPSHEGLPYQSGLEFQSLTQDQTNALTKVVMQLQRENLGDSS